MILMNNKVKLKEKNSLITVNFPTYGFIIIEKHEIKFSR